MVVNTSDGTVWLRRAETRGGLALYAPQDVCRCPEFVMATEAELAEHGITGSADVLPMPVGPDREAAHEARRDRYAKALYEFVNGAFVWEASDDQDSWRAEADAAIVVADAEQATLRSRVAELEAQQERRRVRLVALQNDALNMRGTLSPNGEQRKVPMPLGETLTPAVEWLVNRVAELERRIAAEECRCPEPAPLCEGCRCKCHAEQVKASTGKLSALLAESEPPRSRKHHPDCAAVVQAGAPCTCPPDFTGEDPDDLVNEDEDGCTCPDTGRGEPHDVDCPQADAPGPYDAVLPAVGSGSPEMRELRAALTGSPDGITQRIAPLQALREDPHDGPLHHSYRVPRDLPEMGGTK
jgi:hypothetical protein